jgi:CspA family cold shock protein
MCPRLPARDSAAAAEAEDADEEEGEEMSLTGVVKWFSAERGFGFINSHDRREDVFVHANAVSAGSLEKGDRVVFEIGESERKPGAPCAVNVRVVEAAGDNHGHHGRQED